MKKQIFNPYLPPYEYIPDVEPRIFDDRLYVYGSHDKFNGKWYCENDYVCWSAPLCDLSDWRYEGIIFTKDQDARKGNLYAPDVIQGFDGRYYLYYSKDDSSVIGIAVCDAPSGRYEYYGEVQYPDGTILGDQDGAYFMFDPSILIDEGRIWLYSGSSIRKTTTKLKRNMAGCTVSELERDMKTIKTAPKVILPGSRKWNSETFFEGVSARKIKDWYYLVYPVRNGSGLHYAMSRYPDKDFVHKGCIHSSYDNGIQGHSFWNQAYPHGNNHGGLIELLGEWYIFDHRMTNNSSFSRQGVAEKIVIEADGTIKQVVSSSQGLNGRPLLDEGEYPAYIACNLMSRKWFKRIRFPHKHPFVTQTGVDDDRHSESYVSGLKRGYTAGFKTFAFKGGMYGLTVFVRGKKGHLVISLDEDGKEQLGELSVDNSSDWKAYEIQSDIPQGDHALFMTYRGRHSIELLKFTIKRREESL